MFHVEIRSGMQVVREFNLDDRGLYLSFLEPLLLGREFSVEGHEFIPRHTRIVILEGPELPLDQLGMGRGWGNAERTASDVTESVLAKAREHIGPHQASAPPTAATTAPDALRERLIGRLSAGPVTLADIAEIAADLMPAGSEQERLDAARRVALELLERGAAQLTPSGR